VDAVAFVVHAPGPVMEGFSRAVAATATERSMGIEDVLSLAERHGIEMLGPCPGMSASHWRCPATVLDPRTSRGVRPD